MFQNIKTIPIFVGILLFTACQNDEGLTVEDISIPSNYALSAGISTVFTQSTFAYDTGADWLSGVYDKRFTQGDRLYNDARTSATNGDIGGGLGPVYAGYSCESCHRNTGRTVPANAWETWNKSAKDEEGYSVASGSSGFSSMLVYITRTNGSFFPDYGRVLHDQSIEGVKPEGKLKVKWADEQAIVFPDGEVCKLTYPIYKVTEWYTDGKHNYGMPTSEAVKPEDLIISVRQPLRHVGMGQMMALDPVEIEALAAKSNYPEYGISGRCNYVTEKGKLGLGLSGNKAQHQDLTVELGFSSDMGVTNSRYPEEICEGQTQMSQGSMMGLSYAQLDVSTEEMENVDLYLQALGVPARRLGSESKMVQYGDEQISERELIKIGEQKFYEAKCHLCHVTTLHTKKTGSTLLNGMHLPWLGGQTIHPYSDYLLHDMGSEIMGVGLNDNYVSGLARGNEWRTTPLWGVGLQSTVNGHTHFLHDGRARNFVEAIMWHGGEGEASKNIFKKMPKKDRDALVKFLESL